MKIKHIILANLLTWLFSVNCFSQYSDALLKKAEQGNVAAQMKLAECYLDGNGVYPSEAEALKWYEKAANQNNVQAMIECGNLLCDYDNFDLEPDFVNGIAWYRKAAAKGSAEAKRILAEDLDFSPEEDSHESPFEWHPCADDLDNYEEIKANEAKIKKEFDANNPWAYYYMALLASGEDEDTKAIKYLTDIYPIVMKEKKYYEDFLDISEDYRWGGTSLPARVSTLLGLWYEFGVGVKQDLHKAAEFYLSGSENDRVDDFEITASKVRAAYCYLQSEDYAKFIEQVNAIYLDGGSKKLFVPCLKIELAELYKTGKGVPKDLSKALSIYEEVVDGREDIQGAMKALYEYLSYPDIARAAYKASKMYSNGEGCTKDEDMANLYFDIALKYGDNNAWYEHERK